MKMAFEINNLVAAFFVIALWSILYKDTKLYRFAERTFVGITIGITIVSAYTTIKNNAFIPLTQGVYIVLIPIILGVLMLTRFSKKNAWLSRYPLVIVIGLGIALWTRTAIEGNIISNIKPILTTPIITPLFDKTLGNIYSWIGLVGGLFYFLFATTGLPSSTKKGAEYLNTIGRYIIMIMLGTSFANTLLGRSSMMLERVLFLLRTFGIVP